jgi:hypothetical protein
MTLPILTDTLIQEFDGPHVQALVLLGSHARGDAGPFSDIDLLRLVDESLASLPGDGSHLMNGCLVVASTAGPRAVEEWFTQPEPATRTIAGLRAGHALLDRQSAFATIQARAKAFTWDSTMQRRANVYASGQMVGWIEEVHKGLEGLRRGDIGRLLTARFGLSWGLSGLVTVQKGVLLTGDNDFYTAVAEVIGPDSPWVRQRRTAFGLENEDGRTPSLREQVMAGLRLYGLTAELVADGLQSEDAAYVWETVSLIDRILGPAT